MKLSLQSLGYKLNRETFIIADQNNDFVKAKKRRFLCPTHPGRKMTRICNTCQNNVCNPYSLSIRTVVCQSCQTSASTD